MLQFLRKSPIITALIWVLVAAFTFIGCDPNGEFVRDIALDRAVESQAEKLGLTAAECTALRTEVQALANYAATQQAIRKSRMSHTELLAYALDRKVQAGEMAAMTTDQATALFDAFQSVISMNSSEEAPYIAIEDLQRKGLIETSEASHLNGIAEQMLLSSTPASMYLAIADARNSLASSGFDTIYSSSLSSALDRAEEMVCGLVEGDDVEAQIAGQSTGELQNRCDDNEETCWTEYRWQMAIIMGVVAVLGVLAIIFSWGIATHWVVAIVAVLWTLTVVVHCVILPCTPIPPCPEGQAPACFNGFIFDPDRDETGGCFLANGYYQGDGVFQRASSMRQCLPGYFYTGSVSGCAGGSLTDDPRFADFQPGRDYRQAENGQDAWHRPVCE